MNEGEEVSRSDNDGLRRRFAEKVDVKHIDDKGVSAESESSEKE